jgi:hypothetical protein
VIAILFVDGHFAYTLPKQKEGVLDRRILKYLIHAGLVLFLFSYSYQAMRFLWLIELLLPASSKKKELSCKAGRQFDLKKNSET